MRSEQHLCCRSSVGGQINPGLGGEEQPCPWIKIRVRQLGLGLLPTRMGMVIVEPDPINFKRGYHAAELGHASLAVSHMERADALPATGRWGGPTIWPNRRSIRMFLEEFRRMHRVKLCKDLDAKFVIPVDALTTQFTRADPNSVDTKVCKRLPPLKQLIGKTAIDPATVTQGRTGFRSSVCDAMGVPAGMIPALKRLDAESLMAARRERGCAMSDSLVPY